MYPSDLTDKQWNRLEPLLNEPGLGVTLEAGRESMTASGSGRDAVCGEDRLPVAAVTEQFPSLEDGS